MSSKKYWFTRESELNRSADFRSAPRCRVTTVQDLNESSTLRDQQIALTCMVKKVKRMEGVLEKLCKMQDFYQIMCTGDFANIGIRCYSHNNQLIFYCVNDHKLLCANCMFVGAKGKQGQQRKGSLGPEQPTQNRKHNHHDIKQVSKASMLVNEDVKIWQFEIRDQINLINKSKVDYEAISEAFEQARKTMERQLEVEFDKVQKQISRAYLETKKQLLQLSDKYTGAISTIVNQYNTINKLLIPNRYPVPTVKHSWLSLVKDHIFPEIPADSDSSNMTWVRSYEAHCRHLIKKFGRRKGKLED